MKKIICFILTLTIVLSSFTAFAGKYLAPYEYMDEIFEFDLGEFASGGEGSVSNADTKRIDFLNLLGVWDDTEKGVDELITMTEFSVIMAKLKLGAENAFEGVYTLDSNADSTNVTYNDAYTYLVDALGYKYRLAEYENPEKAVLIVASQIGLISENPENASAYITRGELAKLIVKALEIDMCIMEYTENGGYKYVVTEGKNLLNKVHGIYDISGFVNAIPGLSVYGGTSVRDGYIQIDRRNVNTSGLDLRGYFGSRVQVYATYDDEIKEYSIIYIDYAEDYQVLEIDFSDIVQIRNGIIYYADEEGLEQEIDVNGFDYIIENGDGLTDISKMSDFKSNEGKIVITASQKRGEFDTALIYKYNYFVTTYNDMRTNCIGIDYKQKFEGYEYIQLDANAATRVVINGAASEVSQLTANMAIRVFKCKSTGYMEFIADASKYSGDITALYDDIVKVADKEFRISKDALSNAADDNISVTDRLSQLSLGLNGTFYSVNGVIAGYTTSNVYKWGYLKSVSKEKTSIDPSFTLRILDQDRTWRDITVNRNIELDGKSGVLKETLLSTIEASFGSVNSVVGELVRFKANSDNELIALDTIIKTEYEATAKDDVECVVPDFNEWFNWTYEYIVDSPYWLTASTVVFVVPEGEEDDEDEIKVITNTGLPTGWEEKDRVPCSFYTPDAFNRLGAVVCKIDPDDMLAATAGTPFYVESIRRVVIDADDQLYGYRIFGKSFDQTESVVTSTISEKKFYITEDVLDMNNVPEGDGMYNLEKKIEVGDVINITASGGQISTWSMLLKGGIVPETESKVKTGRPGDHSYCSGIIQKIDTANSLVVVKIGDENYTVKVYCRIIIDPETNRVTHNAIDAFHEGDYVYYSTYYGRAHFMIKNE